MATSRAFISVGFLIFQESPGSRKNGRGPSAMNFMVPSLFTVMAMGRMKTRGNWVHGM